jgi:uncharacterized membrane protein YhiD involved in acid resistance
MPDFFVRWIEPLPDMGVTVLVRLVLAMVLGGVVSFVYRLTRPADETAPSFSVTLVLLSILIAMVTQVIGDNVARAFSLVGALSIVRFRTVVRDTQDTAYVIFSVAVGMAVGAGHSVLAVSGIGIVSIAAFLMRRGAVAAPARHDPYVVKVRLGMGHDPNTLLGATFAAHLVTRHLISIETARQGMALEVTFRAALRDESMAGDFVKALNRLEGVQGISLQRMDAREDE